MFRIARLRPAVATTSVAAIALACLGGTVALTADAVQAAPRQHSRHLVATHKATFAPSQSSFLGTDVLTENGKRVGYDVVSGVVKPTAVTFHVSFALEGGEIFTSLTASGPGALTAKIIGGTGKYQGIKGTVSSQEQDADTTAIDLTYTL